MLLTFLFGGLLVLALAIVAVDSVRATPRQILIATQGSGSPEAALAWARESFAHAVRRYGYRLVHVDDRQLVFERVWRPLATWLVTLLLFPIGLIAFVLGRRTSILVVTIAADGAGGCQVRMSGEVPRTMATKLASTLGGQVSSRDACGGGRSQSRSE